MELLGKVPEENPDKKLRSDLIARYQRLLVTYQAKLRKCSTLKSFVSWLRPSNGPYGPKTVFTKEETRQLLADPPLFFFFCWEAAELENGKNFGMIASLITAETITASLYATRQYYEDDTELEKLVAELFAPEDYQTMGDLLHWLEKHSVDFQIN